MIGRREFITLLGGAAAAWPLAARAQQGERVRRIGVLMPLAADDPEAPARVGALAHKLGELGWTVGPALLDRQILTLNKAELTKTLVKVAEKVRRLGRRLAAEEPDYGCWLLRARRERPSNCCPAEQRDELASFQLIKFHL